MTIFPAIRVAFLGSNEDERDPDALRIKRCREKGQCAGEFSETGRRGVRSYSERTDPNCRLPPKFLVGDKPYCRRHAGLLLLDLATKHLPE